MSSASRPRTRGRAASASTVVPPAAIRSTPRSPPSSPAASSSPGSHPADEEPALAVVLEHELVLIAHVEALEPARRLHRIAGVDEDVDPGAAAIVCDVH